MIDLNENIYSGNFAKALAEENILMDEVFHRVNNSQAPNSHVTGSEPICGTYASPGIDCTGYFIHYHDFGLGDHRMRSLDITMESLFGCSAPTLRQLAARNLQCDIERIRDSYVDKLEKRCKRHNMEAKLNLLYKRMDEYERKSPDALSIKEIQAGANKWDGEHVQL